MERWRIVLGVARSLWKEAFLTGLLALLLGEMCLRFPGARRRLAYTPDDRLEGVLAPSQEGFIWLADVSMKSPLVRLNSDGHRGPETDWTRPFVLAIGDSESMGAGVRDEETWTAELIPRLRAATGRPDLQLVNASHPGHGIFHETVVLDRVLARGRPELVIARIAIGQRNFTEVPAAAIPARLAAARRRAWIRRITQFLPFLHDKLSLQLPRIVAAIAPPFGPHPFRPPAHFDPAVGEAFWRRERGHVDALVARCAGAGIPLVFVVYNVDGAPGSAVLERELARLAADHGGVRVMALTAETFGLRIADPARFAAEFRRRFTLRRDPHGNALQHRIIAGATFRFLEAAGFPGR